MHGMHARTHACTRTHCPFKCARTKVLLSVIGHLRAESAADRAAISAVVVPGRPRLGAEMPWLVASPRPRIAMASGRTPLA